MNNTDFNEKTTYVCARFSSTYGKINHESTYSKEIHYE